MKKKKDLPAREFLKGIGQAVAERTITRRITREVEPYYHMVKLPRKDDMALDTEVAEWCRSNNLVYDHYDVMKGNGDLVKCSVHVIGKVDVEHWDDVAKRVSLGSSMMDPKIENREFEYKTLYKHMRDASILMSGRHLQHGDVTQPSRNLEVFTNCATSATSFLLFYLLLNGSGVGRSYDNKMMLVDYDKLPIVVPVIDMSHKDVQSGEITILDYRTALHFYESKKHTYFEVPDSREGWAKAIEQMEVAAFQGNRTEEVLILDFSKVRARGEPIMGMQGRPASGPGPLISAIQNIAKLRGAGMAPWRSTMYADHYLAECVLVGGARRAARMATKYWKDLGVLDFASVKRGGFLWSSNNSVMVDQEFWEGVKIGDTRATQVFDLVCSNAYYDQTGEPGLINVDRLDWKPAGAEELYSGEFAGSQRFQLDEATTKLTKSLITEWINGTYKVITNPCSEITLNSVGGYCVIGDVVPFHADSTQGNAHWDDDAESAFRATTRALIRTNLMPGLYWKEVKRTNRIGVGITGFHEWVWARFGMGWKEIVDEEKSKEMWLTLSRFKRGVVEEAERYSRQLDVNVPHTNTTIKPAGCASLDVEIKTTKDDMTMRELFLLNGVTKEDLARMEDGTWIEPKIPVYVYDKDNRERLVTKLYKNGVKPVYKVTFENGFEAKLTGNHKLMINGEWVRVDEITT